MTADFRLYLVTWNVGESNPPEDFGQLLGLHERELPDLYAIGLQELKSDTTTLISDSIFDDPWTNAISSTLCQRGYVRVKSLRLVGIHLSVYVKRSQLLDISSVESEFTRTGYAGLWGNKGGVSIRLDVHGVNLCFINSHFSAHPENFALRIEDYNQVLMSQKFRDPDCPNILDNDYVFWLGDLNFRLNDLSNEVVRQKVGDEKFDELLQHDQLNDARSKNLIFLNFEEGAISFPPTFKFDVHTNNYDTSSKGRTPAWCDRILWRVHEDAFAGATLSVLQHKYTSLPEYKNSDHKPVVSSFTVKVLKDSPSQPVMFEPLKCWSRGKDQKVTYSILKVFPTCSRDWIGLYPVNFKNFEEYSMYNWVPQRGEDNQDGTFLCSVTFEERDLHRLSSGRYKLLYFSAVHNHAVGYSDEVELLEPDHATSSEEEQLCHGEADVDPPRRVTPDAQPSGLRAARHPLDPISSEVDSEEKPMMKVEEVVKEEQIVPEKVEKLATCEMGKLHSKEEEEEDEKVPCEVGRATTEEETLSPDGEDFVPAVENLTPEVVKLSAGGEPLKEIKELTTEIKELSSVIEKLDAEVGSDLAGVEILPAYTLPVEMEKLPSERNSADKLAVEVEKLPKEAEKEEPHEELPLPSEPEFEKCTAPVTSAVEMPRIEVTETEKSVTETTPVEIARQDDDDSADKERRRDQKEEQEVDESSIWPQRVEEVDSGKASGTTSTEHVVMGAEKASVVIEEILEDNPEVEEEIVDAELVPEETFRRSPTPEDMRRLTEEMSNPDIKLLSYEEFQEEVEAALASRDPARAVARICDFDVPELLGPLPPARAEVPGTAPGEQVSLESGNEEKNKNELNLKESKEASDESKTNPTPEEQKAEDAKSVGKDKPAAVKEDSNEVESQAEKTGFEPMIRLEDIQKEHDYSKRLEPSTGVESQQQVDNVATQKLAALGDVAEKERQEMVIDTQEKKALDELNASVVQVRPVDGKSITILQQEQQKQTTPSDSETLESTKQESSQDVEKMSQDVHGRDQVPYGIVEEVILAESTSVQAAFKPEEDSSSPRDSKKESLKELEIEKDEESESQTQSSSSDFEVIQLPSKHSPLESFEDAYLSMRGEALADRDGLDGAGKETVEKVTVQSALRSSESEPKDPELIESINAQLLEQNMSGFVESFGDFGDDDLPSIADSANVKLERATKSSVDGKMDKESKEEEECIVVREGVVYEGEDSSNKTESDLAPTEVKVIEESQPQVGHTSEVSDKKVVEFVDNVVATAVQEAVTSCLSLEDDRPKHELRETFESQDKEKAEPTTSDETALPRVLELVEGVEVVQHLDVASHPHVEEDKVEVSVQHQQQQQQEKPQQIQQQEEHVKDKEEEASFELPATETSILHCQELEAEQQPQQELRQASDDLLPHSQQVTPHPDVEVKKESSKLSSSAQLLTSDPETDEKHLEVHPPQSSDKEEHAPSEVPTDDLSKSTPDRPQPADGQNASNFFNAYMDLREKSLADKEQEDKSEKKKEDSMPSTLITQEALKVLDTDLIEKNLSDLSEDMGLEKEKPKEEPKQEEQDGKYEARKEAKLLIEDDSKTKSHTIGDSQHRDVSPEHPESAKDVKDASVLAQESLVVDSSRTLQVSETPAEGDSSAGKEVQSTGTTVFRAPTEDPSLEKTELYQTKPSEVREEIREPTAQ